MTDSFSVVLAEAAIAVSVPTPPNPLEVVVVGGLMGPVGVSGPPGLTGPQGATGLTGLTGATGSSSSGGLVGGEVGQYLEWNAPTNGVQVITVSTAVQSVKFVTINGLLQHSVSFSYVNPLLTYPADLSVIAGDVLGAYLIF